MDTEGLTTGQAAELLEVSTVTIRKWCDSNKLANWRSPSGIRYINHNDPNILAAANAEASVAIPEAAKALGISAHTMRKWCDANKIESWKTAGGRRLVSKKHLDSILASRSAALS